MNKCRKIICTIGHHPSANIHIDGKVSYYCYELRLKDENGETELISTYGDYDTEEEAKIAAENFIRRWNI